MATEFEMPKLGLTMEFGKILSWLVNDGDAVAEGQPIMIIETDKVETEVESSGAGVFQSVAVVGETYDCGSQLGWFLAEGEEAPAVTAPVNAAPVATPAAQVAAPVAAAVASSPSVDSGGRIMASPNAKRVAGQRGVNLRSVVGTGPGGRITSEDVEAAPAGGTPGLAVAGGAVAGGVSAASSATPASLAGRNLANLLGVDLSLVTPASADPRVTKNDVARYVRERLAEAAGPVAPTSPLLPALQTPTSVVPMSGMRGTIASRMHGALQDMAQLTLTTDVDMDAVAADRASRAEAGSVPGYTDYVIAAAAKALRDHPYVNSQVTADGVAYLPEVNVGMAVALDDGLMVPVIKNTDTLSLEDLSVETTRLAEAARSSSLSFGDMEGGTFSVTALGMYGVDMFTPVINPPNTGILGVGRLRDDVAWGDDGTPVKVKRLTLSFTWDHRAFDGAPAAEFARAVKQNLESI